MSEQNIVFPASVVIFKGVSTLKVNILSYDEKSVTYEVLNTPICQFDQHSRARIGVKFFDYKPSEIGEYIFYTQVYDMLEKNEAFHKKVFTTLNELEKIRSHSNFQTPFNLMTRSCSYKVTQEYLSLNGQMMRRLKFCEEEFIVGLHWLLRQKLMDAFIGKNDQLYNMARLFKPGCDIIQSCDYSSADYLSNMFGCLFAGCGRWESHAEYASFNQSCTTPEILEKQLGIEIPRSSYQYEKMGK